MKKLIALLLAAAMIAGMLCACGSSKTETGAKETAAPVQETEAMQEVPEDSIEEEAAPAQVTSQDPLEVCKALLGDCVNLDDYDEPEYNDDRDSVSICQFNNIAGTFAYQLSLDAGADISLNGVTTYQDLLDAGWSANMPETAEGHYRYINSASGPDGNFNGPWFTITVFNASENSAPIGEGYITSVGLEIKYAGDFSLSGITAASSVSDVIRMFGEPYYIYYSDTLGLCLKFKDDISGSLEFGFDASGTMTEGSYTYSDYNLV